MAYNSNKIEGSTLTEDQTAALFEEGFLPVSEDVYRAKDIEEINGHFLMFHHMLATIDAPLSELICWYHDTPIKNLETIARLHSAYERIHPFQDGNGRIGRIIAFKECLKNNIVPFIILDREKCIDSKIPIDLIEIALKDALEALSEITGENVSEDIINEIFSKFCLGK